MADAFVVALTLRCFAVRDLPEGGRQREDLGRGFRSVPYKRSTTIVYRIRKGTIVISGIFYGGQDLSRHYPGSSG